LATPQLPGQLYPKNRFLSRGSQNPDQAGDRTFTHREGVGI